MAKPVSSGCTRRDPATPWVTPFSFITFEQDDSTFGKWGIVMAISHERQGWIERVAKGVFGDLPSGAFDALADDDLDRLSREFFSSVSDPEELHLFARFYSWDGGTVDLHRVIQHPLCDLGTALLVYWRGQPGSYLKYADREAVPGDREVWDLLREIEQRVVTGSYQSASQPFDPASDDGQDLRPPPTRIRRYGRDLPSAMYQAVTSRTTTGV